MTLGDYLERRGNRFLAVAGPIALACAVGLWHFGMHYGFVIPGVFAALVVYGYYTRCPRCGASISYLETGRRRRRSERPGLDHCAKCGLHRDQEVARSTKCNTDQA